MQRVKDSSRKDASLSHDADDANALDLSSLSAGNDTLLLKIIHKL